MSDASEVKRWLVTEEDHGHVIPIEQVTEWHRKTWYKAVEVMPVADHDRVVAELKTTISQLKENEVQLKENEVQLKETTARQASVIEKLREQRNRLMYDETNLNIERELDKELEAIEQGEGM